MKVRGKKESNEKKHFFVQEEDGIRNLVRSRGLEDVYKGQVLEFVTREIPLFASLMMRAIQRSHITSILTIGCRDKPSKDTRK